VVIVDGATLETGMKGVYGGGDAAAVPGAIIHAIAARRKEASSIDKALGGTGDIEEVLFERGMPTRHLGREEGFASWAREKAPDLAMQARRQGFQEVSLGYAEEQAVKEARRCLQCDLRLFMGCNPTPPEKVLAFNRENVDQVPEEEGAFRLYDEDHQVLVIKGTADLKKELLMALDQNEKAFSFEYELDKMYSKRESELIQKYLQVHGRMPGAGDEEDDLF